MTDKPKKASGEIIKIARNPANQQVFITIKTTMLEAKDFNLGRVNLKQGGDK